jgi:imidazolonepropionase-like amidohydrolase
VIFGGRDAWRAAERLRAMEVPVILEGTQTLNLHNWDPYDTPFTLPLKLHEAGVEFCIGWDGGMPGGTRNLPYQAATAAAYGLPKDEALKAVTLYPARIFGVEDRVGSLTVGKDATLIVTDGDPLEIRTHVEQMFIQGRAVDLSSRHTMLYEKYQEKYQQ